MLYPILVNHHFAPDPDAPGFDRHNVDDYETQKVEFCLLDIDFIAESSDFGKGYTEVTICGGVILLINVGFDALRARLRKAEKDYEKKTLLTKLN